MHAERITLGYVCGAVLLLFGSICVLIRFFVRRRRDQYFRDRLDAPRELNRSALSDEYDCRAEKPPPLMPPPLPKNEFEFYQAGQYAMDQNLPPLPSPPPKRERDDW